MTINTTPRIAAVVYEDGAALNQLFSELVDSLRSHRVQLGGVIQTIKSNDAAKLEDSCDKLGLEDLYLEQDVSLPKDENDTGCDLDTSTLSQVAKSLSNQLSDPDKTIELFIINRFGQSESEGKGMFNVFAEAVMEEIPVLTAVKKGNLESWEHWHGGVAVYLEPDKDHILKWCLAGS
jgi:hypothetical protein